jgi:2-polyprenyl-3-methyl-5-hydroxy-6-metoxy-1,4-benzoquinol methylase
MINELTTRGVHIGKTYAVDMFPQVSTLPNTIVIKHDLNQPNVPIKDKTINFVFSLETIEHLTNTYTFVKEISRILVEDGIVLINTPNLLAWYNRIIFPLGGLPIHYEVNEIPIRYEADEIPTHDESVHFKKYGRLIARRGPIASHIRVFSPKALSELLEEHGLHVLEVKGIKFLSGRMSSIDSFFSNFPSLSSTFSLIGKKVG